MKLSTFSAFLVCSTLNKSLEFVLGQSCPSFNKLNSTSLSNDFSRINISPSCPSHGFDQPKGLHWHISSHGTSDIPAVFASDLNVFETKVSSDALSFDFKSNWNGRNSDGVGAEIRLPSNKLVHVEAVGIADTAYIEDTEGTIQNLDSDGVDNRFYVTSTSSGTIRYKSNGVAGILVLYAPDAHVVLDVDGVDNDVRINAKSVAGKVEGVSNRVFVQGGGVLDGGKIRARGVDNRVYMNSDSGCRNVDTDIINKCRTTEEAFGEVNQIDCQGASGRRDHCSGAFFSKGTIHVIVLSFVGYFLVTHAV